MAKSSRQMRISRSPYDAGYVGGSDKPILSVRGCVYHMVSGVLLWAYPIETKKSIQRGESLWQKQKQKERKPNCVRLLRHYANNTMKTFRKEISRNQPS